MDLCPKPTRKMKKIEEFLRNGFSGKMGGKKRKIRLKGGRRWWNGRRTAGGGMGGGGFVMGDGDFWILGSI
jgi:hypothetical protein